MILYCTCVYTDWGCHVKKKRCVNLICHGASLHMKMESLKTSFRRVIQMKVWAAHYACSKIGELFSFGNAKVILGSFNTLVRALGTCSTLSEYSYTGGGCAGYIYCDLVNSSLVSSSLVPFHSGIARGKNACLYIRVLAPVCRNLMLLWLLAVALDGMRWSSAGIACRASSHP